MDIIKPILDALVLQLPILNYILGGLAILYVVLAEAIRMTPSKADDEQLSKLEKIPLLGMFLTALKKFSPLGRKE